MVPFGNLSICCITLSYNLRFDDSLSSPMRYCTFIIPTLFIAIPYTLSIPFISRIRLSSGLTMTFDISCGVAPGKATIIDPPLTSICGSSSLGIICNERYPKSNIATAKIGVRGLDKNDLARCPAIFFILYLSIIKYN